MNVHGIVSGIISTVNPNVQVTVVRSTGYTTSASGKQIPTTRKASGVSAQIQGVKANELQHLNGLGIQGVLRSIHLNGDWRGIQRADKAGGDTILFNDHTWLVVWVYETWPDWSRVIVAMQQ